MGVEYTHKLNSMLKAIKIRLYPNNGQEIYINKLLGCYRFVYNKCLDIKIKKYTEEGVNYNLKDLGNYFHQDLSKNEDYNWLNEHNTKVLKQSIINLLDSYKRFFINGNGFPKFKSKHDNKLSCRFPSEAISKKNNYLTNKLTLTGELKNIKFKCSDEYAKYLDKHKSNIKSATLSKTKSGNYFLSILIDGDLNKTLNKTNNSVGIDLGIKDFIITSESEIFENIKIKRNNKNKLVKLNRSLSKKQKGSKNKNKARIKLARFHNKLNNKKENYLHHVVNTLLNENQVIVMENLNIKGMMKNHNLAKSIQELSLYRFKEILKYKAEWYGRDIIEIDRWFPSSKLCSNCGNKNNELKLKDREWTCTSCNTTHDRDVNAAINILNEGKRILNNKIPIRDGELTPLEISPAGTCICKSSILSLN
jgi:putative transposase